MALGVRHTQMDIDDFMSSNVAVIKDKYYEIGSYTLGIRELIALGWGKNQNRVTAEGRIWGIIKSDADAELTGIVKFEVRDQEGNLVPGGDAIKEVHTNRLNTVPSELPNRPKIEDMTMFLDDTGVTAGRERVLTMLFKSDTTATVSATNSKLLMSVTKTYL